MIFTHLKLHNYSAFRGRQVLDLQPENRERPVVLIGAMNGSGKTSLLDAFHLALYGKRARTSNRGDLGYDEYLRQCVHSGCESEGAALELGFVHRRDGKDRDVVVHRQWKDAGRTVRETVDVVIDGHRDLQASEHWDEEIENILPIGIASLFLFDAEKIEQLADLQQAQSILTTAIEGLLGLELVSQLDLDLRALPTYLTTQQRKHGARATEQQAALWSAAQTMEQDVERLRMGVEHAVQQAAAAQNRVDEAHKVLAAAEHKWTTAGGNAHAAKASLEKQRARLEHERDSCNARLRELMADALPFSLVRDQLEKILSVAQREEEANRQAVVVAELQRRDQELLDLVGRMNLGRAELSKVVGHLESDRAKRERAAHVEQRLGLSPHGQQQVQSLLGGVIDRQVDEAKALNKRIDKAENELEDVARFLARVPADATIAELSNKRDAAVKAHSAAQQLLQTRQEEVAKRKSEHELAAAKLAKVLTELLEADAASARERRLLAQAQEIRAQLQAFRTAAVRRHTKRIGAAVLECFQSLIRKASLLDSLQINSETYEITLYDKRGRVLPPKRMSAGERQLLATSLLWGLSRVSGRALPTVIDTPLGRMDSAHRRNLVERYFPQASHQVILLSTDEEINGGWLSVLEPAIGRTYLLEHDDETRQTAVKAGYFALPVAV